MFRFVIPKEIKISKLINKASYSTLLIMLNFNKQYANWNILRYEANKIIPILAFIERLVCGLFPLEEKVDPTKYIY